MKVRNFSFGDHHAMFDDHKERSIPGYQSLMTSYVSLSQDFVQENTMVVDYGCSTGNFLSTLRDANEGLQRDVTYVGVDIEQAFAPHWAARSKSNLRFEVCDMRRKRFRRVSLACSLFTIQFLPMHVKRTVLKSIREGLVDGGAFMIAEKVLATSARFQDALTFPYYDFKLEQGFTASEILDKERQLRGQMTLWTFDELRAALTCAGFTQLEAVWGSFPFLGIVALK